MGERDQVISPEQRRQIADALEEANVRYDVVEYAGVGHGFLNDRRDAFDAAAADNAWARIRALFADELVTSPERANARPQMRIRGCANTQPLTAHTGGVWQHMPDHSVRPA